MLFSYVICPATEIDILIGLKYAGYHPVRQQLSEYILVLGNKFGCCIGGSQPLL